LGRKRGTPQKKGGAIQTGGKRRRREGVKEKKRLQARRDIRGSDRGNGVNTGRNGQRGPEKSKEKHKKKQQRTSPQRRRSSRGLGQKRSRPAHWAFGCYSHGVIAGTRQKELGEATREGKVRARKNPASDFNGAPRERRRLSSQKKVLAAKKQQQRRVLGGGVWEGSSREHEGGSVNPAAPRGGKEYELRAKDGG